MVEDPWFSKPDVGLSAGSIHQVSGHANAFFAGDPARTQFAAGGVSMNGDKTLPHGGVVTALACRDPASREKRAAFTSGGLAAAMVGMFGEHRLSRRRIGTISKSVLDPSASTPSTTPVYNRSSARYRGLRVRRNGPVTTRTRGGPSESMVGPSIRTCVRVY